MRTLTLIALVGLTACEPAYEPQAHVEFYEGTRASYQADGFFTGEVDLLVRKSIDPEQGRIDETIVIFAEGFEPMTMSNGCSVSDDAIDGTMTDDYGTLTIQGTMYGKAWMWDEWDTQMTYVDGALSGSVIDGYSEMCQEGIITEKEMRDASGSVVGTATEMLNYASASDWEAGLQAMGLTDL